MQIGSVAPKLFTGIENFPIEDFPIMAIPFFALAGNVPAHGGIAEGMIAFTTSLVGHWPGGLGLAGGVPGRRGDRRHPRRRGIVRNQAIVSPTSTLPRVAFEYGQT